MAKGICQKNLFHDAGEYGIGTRDPNLEVKSFRSHPLRNTSRSAWNDRHAAFSRSAHRRHSAIRATPRGAGDVAHGPDDSLAQKNEDARELQIKLCRRLIDHLTRECGIRKLMFHGLVGIKARFHLSDAEAY